MANAKMVALKEFAQFLRAGKKWWLTPIVAAAILLGILLVAARGSTITPFTYNLF